MNSVTLIYKTPLGKRETITEVIKFAVTLVQTADANGDPLPPVPSYLIGKQNGLTILRTVAEISLFFVE